MGRHVSSRLGTRPHHASFDHDILQIINTLINTIIDAGSPLKQWLSSTVLMIEKVTNTPRTSTLRVIYTYEADYNLVLNYFGRNNLLKCQK